MSEIRDLKCQCCRCYDSFDGCTAWDCSVDFELSMTKVKHVSNESGMSVASILALLELAEKKMEKETEENILPDDFNPFYDSKFMISNSDESDSDKRMLVEMHVDELKRLRAEIDATLKIQGDA